MRERGREGERERVSENRFLFTLTSHTQSIVFGLRSRLRIPRVWGQAHMHCLGAGLFTLGSTGGCDQEEGVIKCGHVVEMTLDARGGEGSRARPGGGGACTHVKGLVTCCLSLASLAKEIGAPKQIDRKRDAADAGREGGKIFYMNI